MPLDLIVGAQWGDEGKGRVTDLLAAEADWVARGTGGDNAGHTVTVGEEQFKLHLIPSGIVHPKPRCLLGPGMVVNPQKLVDEMDRLQAMGVDLSPQRLKLSYGAHIITPAHLALDDAEEIQRGEAEIGTTRRGIGPAYSDKAARRGLRAAAMANPTEFGAAVSAHLRRANRLLESFYDQSGPDPDEAGRRYAELAERLNPYLDDGGRLIDQALRQGQTVLGEGAQGTLLDLDHGTYPYVTSCNPTAAGMLTGLGVGAGALRRVIGVTKAFQTRVGAGPFPTEVEGSLAEQLRGSGENPWDEFGTTTGRPRRVGWLDGVLLRYAVRVNGLTELCLTKLDILSGIDPLKLSIAYQRNGQRFEDLPAGPSDLEGFKAQLEAQSAWDQNLWELRRWEDLPAAARTYVKRLEVLAGVPVLILSVGPERTQTIVRS